LFIICYRKDEEEEDSLNRAWSGDVSPDSRLAVTANDDCTLKIFSLQGVNTILAIESEANDLIVHSKKKL